MTHCFLCLPIACWWVANKQTLLCLGGDFVCCMTPKIRREGSLLVSEENQDRLPRGGEGLHTYIWVLWHMRGSLGTFWITWLRMPTKPL